MPSSREIFPTQGSSPGLPRCRWISLQTEPPENSKYADDTTVMAESEEELKGFLMRLREKSEKGWLKTQHSKN